MGTGADALFKKTELRKEECKMGLFDNLKKEVAKAVQNVGNKSEDVVFAKLPDTLEEFQALPQAALTDPFAVAALTVLAFCFYPEQKDVSLAMLDFLRGPRPLSPAEKQFINDRFMDQDYVPRSYFKGATPQNDYVPAEPYTVHVSENPYSHDQQGYVKLFLTSGGADSPRDVVLRQAKDGKWYLWDQHLLPGIRQPESANPWA